MSKREKIAKPIKTLIHRKDQLQIAYDLSHPIIEYDYDNKPVCKHTSVIVSMTNVMFSGWETYIFPCNSKGVLLYARKLKGSRKGKIDPDSLLMSLGYKVILEDNENE